MECKDILRTKKSDLSKNFIRVGKGSSRYVYDAGDGKTVIKCAVQSGKGVTQNRTEYETHEYVSGDVDILCPVYEISEDDSILIMAKAIPINKLSELSEEAQATVRAFKKHLKQVKDYYYSKKNSYPTRKLPGYGEKLTEKQINTIKKDSLFQDICTLTLDYDIMDGDLFRICSWGYLNGKVVLIDYGLSVDCYSKYYDRRKGLRICC